MNSKLLETRDRVQRLLTEMLNTVLVDKEGRFHFRQGSSHIFVKVREWGESTLVDVFAPTNFNLTPSLELYRYVATNVDTFVFGRMAAHEDKDKVNLVFGHTLLADTLDPDELKWTVYVIADVADKIDTEIRDKFGGEIMYDGAP